MLKKRVITALCSIPLLIVAVWFDQPLPWFTIFVAIWGLLAALEFYNLVSTSKISPLTYFGLIWTLFFILSPHFSYDLTVPILLTSAVILPLFWLLLHPQNEGAFIGWAWTIAGILYVGWFLSYFVALRGLDNGREWVFLALFATFASDTAAFFIGRALGKHLLAPHISPGKTWEGSIAGIFGSIIISLALVTLFDLPLNYGWTILLGLLISVLGQLGDLVESLLKRNMKVKDSGRVLPGHGGFLDRMDSIVFAGIVVYYFVLIIQ